MCDRIILLLRLDVKKSELLSNVTDRSSPFSLD
jgi:hypothetical protein